MSGSSKGAITRRDVAAGLAASLIMLDGPVLGQSPAPAETDAWQVLNAAPKQAKLHDDAQAAADLWCFNDKLPGPILRIRHGEEARLRLQNRTRSPLSLHWHGVRNVNAMDGVGGLTQAPVREGQDFEYRFTPPDIGTFLIRPLVIGASSEPTERGLSGVLIVDEADPPKIDAEYVLFVDDWRLNPNGTLAPFGDPIEAATSGRLGNWLAVDGRAAPRQVEVAPGARIRLRLANGCNARSMRIRFDGLRAYVIAVDGQPTDSFEPLRSTLPFSPGNRYDMLIEMPLEAGVKGALVALLGPGVPLVTLVTRGDPASSTRPALPPIVAPPQNKHLPPAIRLQDATRRDATIAGGARRDSAGQALFDGDPARIWTINGTSGELGSKPLLSVKRGTPVVLAIRNATPLVQPFHLHGHVFRLLHPFDDGWEPYWLDTLQIPENKTVRIAFLADNPGKWLLASTVLERFDTGLWTWLEVL